MFSASDLYITLEHEFKDSSSYVEERCKRENI